MINKLSCNQLLMMLFLLITFLNQYDIPQGNIQDQDQYTQLYYYISQYQYILELYPLLTLFFFFLKTYSFFSLDAAPLGASLSPLGASLSPLVHSASRRLGLRLGLSYNLTLNTKKSYSKKSHIFHHDL